MSKIALEKKEVQEGFKVALETKIKNLKETGEMTHHVFDKAVF